MELIFTFLSSSAAKWIAILLSIIVVGGYLFYTKIQYADLKTQIAKYEYNINQLNQSLKDEQALRKHVEEISQTKSEVINKMIQEKDEIETKMKEVEVEIEKEVVKGNDRPSSNILKETIRRLSGQK